jgi:hypothetical protein
LQIACQNNNPKSVRADYRYPISYRNAKMQAPEKGFALIEKRYHKNFYRNDTCVADTCNFVLETTLSTDGHIIAPDCLLQANFLKNPHSGRQMI